MRHKNYALAGCPVEVCTEVIGGKWKGKILFFLCQGTKRHGELRKLIPEATQRMLTNQLRELEEDGIVVRKAFAESPPRVEYSLSDFGETLRPIIDAMWHWGKTFIASLPADKKQPPAR